MITIHARNANSLWTKTKGLLGTTQPESIYFETRWGIHTFGMKYSIDVIILNKQNIVVVCKNNLQPNNIFFWNPKYKRVLELPEGMIEKMKITKGLALSMKYSYAKEKKKNKH